MVAISESTNQVRVNVYSENYDFWRITTKGYPLENTKLRKFLIVGVHTKRRIVFVTKSFSAGRRSHRYDFVTHVEGNVLFSEEEVKVLHDKLYIIVSKRFVQ